MLTSLLYVLLAIALVGAVVWGITNLVPMPPAFRTLIIVIAVIVLILWLMGLLGGAGPFVPSRVPRL